MPKPTLEKQIATLCNENESLREAISHLVLCLHELRWLLDGESRYVCDESLSMAKEALKENR